MEGQCWPTRQKCAKFLPLGMVLINLACLIFTIVAVSVSSREPQTQDIPMACVSREKLVGKSSAPTPESHLKKLSFRTVRGKASVCALNGEQLLTLLELVRDVSARRARHRNEPHEFRKVAPLSMLATVSAHKQLVSPVGELNTAEGQLYFPGNITAPLQLNETTDPQIEHVSNVEMLQYGMRVLYTGMYMIYGEVLVGSDAISACPGMNARTWELVIVRIRPNDVQSTGVLLKAGHMVNCTTKGETIHSGGVFHLLAGDLLMPQMSGYAMLRPQRGSNYMGIHMLGHPVSSQ